MPSRGDRHLLELVTTYWKTFGIRMSVERELAQEIVRPHKATESLSQTAAKKALRSHSKSGGKRNPSNNLPGKRLPRVLTMERQLTILDKLWVPLSEFIALVPRTWIGNRLKPNPNEMTRLAAISIQEHHDKITAC